MQYKFLLLLIFMTSFLFVKVTLNENAFHVSEEFLN